MDPFAYVGDQEAAVIRRGKQEIASNEARVRYCKAVQVLKQSAGWEEYQKSVAGMAEAQNAKLLDEGEEKREYRAGVCAGLFMVLRLMRHVDVELQRLEQALTRLSESAKTWTPDGRVLPSKDRI